MVTKPTLSSDLVADDPLAPQAAWRTGPVFVTPVTKLDAEWPEASEMLLDYTRFALEQEARYCQQ